jgi:phosphate-selective porin OprO/OprP
VPDPVPWSRFDTRWVTVQPTGALALDFVRYGQDAASRDHVGDLTAFEVPEVRALRAGLLGKINFDRPWLFYVAGAYRGFGRGFDRDKDAAWGLFDLSLTIPIPKLGRVTVGRTKEPFSMERIMGGGVQPGIERAMGTDALTPARNAGVQFRNSFANDRMTWAAGVFNDWLFNEERLESGSTQLIGRMTGLPIDRPDGAGLLHLGVAGRYSNVKPGSLRFENTPEVFSSPLFVDTEEFPAEAMTHVGLEAYYQKGPLWLGAEHISARVSSPEYGDPRFSSLFVQASWIVNGESRPYVRSAGIFGVLRPRTVVSQRGAGLVELGARYSMVDLEDGQVRGGEMSRFTGIANWYLTRGALASFNYGLVRLERNQKDSYTHMFQLRLFLVF